MFSKQHSLGCVCSACLWFWVCERKITSKISASGASFNDTRPRMQSPVQKRRRRIIRGRRALRSSSLSLAGHKQKREQAEWRESILMTLHPLGAAAPRAFFLFLIYPRLLRQKTSCVMMQEQHIRNLSHFLPSFICALSRLLFYTRDDGACVCCVVVQMTPSLIKILMSERAREKAGLEQQMERARLLFAAIWWSEKKSRRRKRAKKKQASERARASERPFLLQPICFMAPLCQWHSLLETGTSQIACLSPTHSHKNCQRPWFAL